MTLAARFMALKQKVGGNHEKMNFEFTFGAQPEERAHITGLSPSNLRILSEINFALQLSEVNDGKFDALIDQALSILESAIAKDGALINAVCEEAEKVLLPLSEDAKEYEVIYAAHAHIDMNWMWGWQETVAATLATFRTMLNLMKQYPDFTFMQSQGSVYKIVEKYDPAMMQEIKQRIAEGRWEITASAWVETDKNMPDTESLLHHIFVTRQYMKDVWGIDPNSVEVDFSPDTFGHSRFIPEINRFGNVKYYYHCRGMQENETLYRYRAPSGAELLMYKEPYWYNSGVNPDNGTGVIGLSKRCAGLKTALVVYGVGDHGGGATRRDVERVLEMQKWPVFPNIHFGTLHDYFHKAEAVREQVHVIEHELNPFSSGCYTTQSRIKLGNRKSEVSLNDSTKICALGKKLAGAEYPTERFTAAWQDVLFTHFHDILTGSCVQESREYAMGLFADALSYTQTAQSNAMRVLSEAIDTSAFVNDPDIAAAQAEGAGAGYDLESYGGVPNPERGVGKTRVYTVFNTASSERTDNVLITVWDYVGDLRRLEVTDSEGNALPFDLLDRSPLKYWDHQYVRLLVTVTVPAIGYVTLSVHEKELQTYPTYYLDDERIERPCAPVILENAFIKATFDVGSGAITSILDKSTGKEQLGAPACLCLMETEHRTSSAWRIGRHLKAIPVDHTTEIVPMNGLTAQSVEITQKIMSSTAKTTVTLGAQAHELSFAFEIDWNEAANKNDTVPVLVYRVPVKGHPETMMYDVPAGFVTSGPEYIDKPAQTFAAAIGEDAALAIMTDCKYGYRLADGILYSTLINTAGSPDPYPERGIHKIQLWLSTTNGDPVTLKRRSEALLRPLVAMSTSAKAGKLAANGSLMKVSSAGSILSSVELTSEDALAVRFYEMKGQPDHITIELSYAITSASCTDGTAVSIEGNTVSFDIPSFTIREVHIT